MQLPASRASPLRHGPEDRLAAHPGTSAREIAVAGAHEPTRLRGRADVVLVLMPRGHTDHPGRLDAIGSRAMTITADWHKWTSIPIPYTKATVDMGKGRDREPRRRDFDDDYRPPARPQSRPARPMTPANVGDPQDAVVKWFNPEKGFGFVELSDGSGDAFLHVNPSRPQASIRSRPAPRWSSRSARVPRALRCPLC